MCCAIPWEETDEYIRSGHRSSDDFESDSLRTITLSEEEGIKAVVGKPKGKDTTEIQSYLFAKDKGWTLDKAKAWFEEHKPVKEHVHAVLPFQVLEKIVDKPLRIRGVAMTAGMSRNFNIYTPDELQAFASKLVSAPVYVEHVAVPSACGKVTKTEWDGQALWYEAEIYEGDVADKIRKGLVQHVSVGADYEAIDVVDGKVPHGLHNAELSLVAVPGIPETNIQVLERLRESLSAKGPVKIKEQNGDVSCAVCGAPADFLVSICQKCLDKAGGVAEQVDPLVAGEYFLGFYQDPALFLPEHFRAAWLDQSNGVLAVMAKVRADPAQERCQSILFLKTKWQPNTVSDWLVVHPEYIAPASVTASLLRGIENMQEKDLEKFIVEAVQKGNVELKETREKLIETEGKLGAAEKALTETNDKLSDTESKLAEAQQTLEQLSNDKSSDGGLVKNPSKTVPIIEAVEILEGLLPSSMVENSSMGMKRECQDIRRAILKLKERM